MRVGSETQIAEITATVIIPSIPDAFKSEIKARFRLPKERHLVDLLALGPAAVSTEIWLAMVSIAVLGFVLGFAMNHGSICTVIATTELVLDKRPARFIALAECAIWAALVYAILETLPTMQEGWSPLAYLAPAAILFGVGTYVNGARVFGSVGHLGNGEIDFGFTFLGIFAVSSIESLFDVVPHEPPVSASSLLGPVVLALVLFGILALRYGVSLKSKPNFQRLTLSMGAIGIASPILAGFAPWFSITTSVGSILSIPIAGTVVSVCMLLGSLLSARIRRRRFKLKWPTLRGIARRTDRVPGGGVASAVAVPSGQSREWVSLPLAG